MNGMFAVDRPLTTYELARLRERFQELWPLDWQNITIIHGGSVQQPGPSEYKHNPDTTTATWPNAVVATNE